jgi:hypothetical protein
VSPALSAVNINGAPVRCADLEAVLTHGRRKVTDGPTASSAPVTIYNPDMPTWEAGDPITVHVHQLPVPRFTGTITDVALVGHTTLGGVFEVTAMGQVATLGHRDVGDIPWPVESPHDRATRILIKAGLPFRVADTSSLRVNARDVDRQEALTLIGDLASDTGAAVFDTPDGVVVFQHYSTRAQTWLWFRWVDEPPEATWDIQTDRWSDMEVVSPAAPLPLVVDGCAVLWEPTWVSTSGDIVNSVSIEYGPEVEGGSRPRVTTTNPDSVARFGRKHVAGPGGLADAPSAMERGGMILDLHSFPHWAIDNVVVLLDRISPGEQVPTLANSVLGLLCGAKVQLLGMPQPAPEYDPVRIVEGWTHTLSATTDTLLLHLSDPAHSYAGITWSVFAPTTPRWVDVDPAVIWTDVITMDDLVLVDAP